MISKFSMRKYVEIPIKIEFGFHYVPNKTCHPCQLTNGRARHACLPGSGCTTTSAYFSNPNMPFLLIIVLRISFICVHSHIYSISIVTQAHKKNLSACMHLPGVSDTTPPSKQCHTRMRMRMLSIGLHSFSCLSLCRFLSPVLILDAAGVSCEDRAPASSACEVSCCVQRGCTVAMDVEVTARKEKTTRAVPSFSTIPAGSSVVPGTYTSHRVLSPVLRTKWFQSSLLF